jgi:hypothetical protein
LEIQQITGDVERLLAERTLYSGDDGVFVVVWDTIENHDKDSVWDKCLELAGFHSAASEVDAKSVADGAVNNREFEGCSVFVIVRVNGDHRTYPVLPSSST